MPQRGTTTAPARAPTRTSTTRAFIGRSSMARQAVLVDELGTDPQQGPESFEAWITDLQPTQADTRATQTAANARPGHALTVQVRLLRRRSKLARALLIAATIGLPLVLLLHAVQASAAGQRPAARSATPHPLLAGSPRRAVAPWLAGPAHLDSADLAEGTLDIQPAGTDSAVVYACWVDAQPGPSGSAAGAGRLHLAASDDRAYTWRALSAPVSRAAACHLVPDGDDARHVALMTQLGAGVDTDSACPSARTFLSADGGRHWSALILPGALADECMPSLARQASPPAAGLSVVSGTLALWTNRAPPPSEKARSAQLWISLDFGATWRVVGTGLPSGSIESVVSARADGALLALVRRPDAGTSTATPASYELWSCDAGCPRWQRLARVPSMPGSAPAVFAASGAWLLPGADWGTLYAVDAAQAATSIYVNTEARDGAWRLLPPVPWLGSEGTTAAAMSSRVLGVGPAGALVLELHNAALQMEPGSAVQEQSAVSVVCVWDPVRGQWVTPLLVEPATSSALAVVWDEQSGNGARWLTIWFGTRSGDVWSIVIPSSDWSGTQAAPRCQRCG